MTTFKTVDSPYKSNNTASNMCGFTLMNNQVGAVVADVMSTKPNVKVMPNDGDLLDFFLAVGPDELTRNRILAENPA